MESLELQSPQKVRVYDVSEVVWPASLKTLKIGLPARGLLILPANLTLLRFNRVALIENDLDIWTCGSSGKQRGFPSGLVDLKYRSIKGALGSFQRVSRSFLESLPTRIRHLDLHTAQLGSGAWAYLSCFSRLETFRAGYQLPSACAALFLQSDVFRNIVDLKMDVGANWKDEDCSLFSRNMKRLHLDSFGFNSAPLTENCLQYLPKSLVSLKISCSPIGRVAMLTRKGFVWLSSLFQLEELELDFMTLNVTDSAIALLPRSLRSLVLRGATSLTGHCFQYMPRFLSELVVFSLTVVNEAHLALLPRNLRSVELSAARIHMNDQCQDRLPTTADFAWIGSRSSDDTTFSPKRSVQFDQLPDHRVKSNSFQLHNDVSARNFTWMYV